MCSTRYVSYKIIYDTKYNNKFSNLQINKYLKNSEFSYQDRGFITAIVYGVLSRIFQLDFMIRKLSKIPFRNISKKTLVILEMSLYQKYFMNVDADYAIVNEAVKICKKEDKRAYKFVNALLRNAPDELIYPDFSKFSIYEKYSLKYNVSSEIVKRFLSNYGNDFTSELLESMYDVPKTYIRANNLKINFEDFVLKLEQEKIEYEVVEKENLIFSCKNLKDIDNNKLFIEGLFSIQDYASMKPVLKMDVHENDEILDCCSAPGGKSIFLAQKLKNKSKVISVDISETKLDKLKQEIKRLGIQNIEILTKDMTKFYREFENKFDKVLCDVPCSGLGILRRKPEIRYHNLDSIVELNKIQISILNNASKYLKINGELLYSTCTLGKEENDFIVEKFLKENNSYILKEKKEYFPHIDDTDGFFICRMKRVK